MNWVNPVYYIGIPFTYLWGIIKEANTIRNRIFMIVLGMLFVIVGVVLLIKWHKIPSYTHYINVERIYSKDSVKDGCYQGFYELTIDNNKNNDSRGEMDRFFVYRTYDKIKGISYKNMKNIRSDKEYKSNENMLNPKDSFLFNRYFSLYKLELSDFNFGFRTIHAYQNDMTPLDNEVRFHLPDVRYKNSFDKISWNGAILSISSKKSDKYFDFFTSMDTAAFRGVQYDNMYATLSFDRENTIIIDKKSDKHSNSSFFDYIEYLFSPYDVSKAKYRLYLSDCGVDTMCYTISYTDMVKFSPTSTETYKISENSISFYSYISDESFDKLIMKTGVQYYVDFLEATNIQNIRIIILTALLALPMGLVVKNGWALLISTRNKTNTPIRRKKKIKKKKHKKIICL